MIDKRTVFVLGAGASCPYGFPSGAHLRRYICLSTNRPSMRELVGALDEPKAVSEFRKKFEASTSKSIDLFMARNPKLAPAGKCFVSFEIFEAESRSLFRERAVWQNEVRRQQTNTYDINAYLQMKDFQGGDWYSYLFDRLTAELVEKDVLPDFSNGQVAFITFNYDRSLEYFLYESVRNSFTEVPESQVVGCLKNLRILHIYGQVAPLKWQDPNEGMDYHPQPIDEALLRKAAENIKTIFEEKESPELTEAHRLLESAERIFFLGFGYAPENMEVLNLPDIIPPGCDVYGTAFGMMDKEVGDILSIFRSGRRPDSDGYKKQYNTKIETCDCLMLLRNYL